MASRQLFLFATRKDLEPGIRGIEAVLRLKYALCGLFDSPDVLAWQSLLDVDSLGQAPHGNVGFCKRYLILRDGVAPNVRNVPQRKSGQMKYAVDQLVNPTSITFQPGGLFDDEHVVCGSIGTASYVPESIELLREYARAIIGGFVKHDIYYIGPEAKERHSKGARLITMSIEEKPEYDLVIK